MSEKYTGAVQLLCKMVVNIFPQAHQHAGGRKRRQRVSGLGADCGNKYNQNGRGGRGYGGVAKEVAEDVDVDMVVEEDHKEEENEEPLVDAVEALLP